MYDVEHHYMTVIGDAYGGTERWQFGLRLTSGGVNNETTALAASTIVENWWRANAPFAVNWFGAPSTHRLVELKVASIQPNGEYVTDDPAYSHFYLPAIAGAGAPPAGLLPQSSVCATLLTDVPRGYASKGRIYLPPSTRYTPGTDGLLTAPVAEALANNVMQLVTSLNAATNIGDVAVFSKGRGVKVENVAKQRYEWTYPEVGTHRSVTAVKVGRVVDTQRRRRRQLTESYQTDTI